MILSTFLGVTSSITTELEQIVTGNLLLTSEHIKKQLSLKHIKLSLPHGSLRVLKATTGLLRAECLVVDVQYNLVASWQLLGHWPMFNVFALRSNIYLKKNS